MSRILIVDDSWLVRTTVSQMLTDEGHEVSEAINGVEAIESLEIDVPDCLLLDLSMPEMDGFELLAEIKKQEMKVPVLIFSTETNKTTLKKCSELGATGFVKKPPEIEDIRNALLYALSGEES